MRDISFFGNSGHSVGAAGILGHSFGAAEAAPLCWGENGVPWAGIRN